MSEETHHWACTSMTEDGDCDCYLSDRRVRSAVHRIVLAAQGLHPSARSPELRAALHDLDIVTTAVCRHLRVAEKCTACEAERPEREHQGAPECTCGAKYSARAHDKHCAFQVWSFGQALPVVDRA